MLDRLCDTLDSDSRLGYRPARSDTGQFRIFSLYPSFDCTTYITTALLHALHNMLSLKLWPRNRSPFWLITVVTDDAREGSVDLSRASRADPNGQDDAERAYITLLSLIDTHADVEHRIALNV